MGSTTPFAALLMPAFPWKLMVAVAERWRDPLFSVIYACQEPLGRSEASPTLTNSDLPGKSSDARGAANGPARSPSGPSESIKIAAEVQSAVAAVTNVRVDEILSPSASITP